MKITKIALNVIVAAMALSALQGCDNMDDIESSYRVQHGGSSGHNSNERGRDYTIWNFVYSSSLMYYLWEDNIPDNINIKSYESPFSLFEDIRYRDDRFSFVTDSYSEMVSKLDNVYETDGICYDLYNDPDDNGVIAVVNYVYDNTPAKAAGIQRGYVIKQVNGTRLTPKNYQELLDSRKCTYGYTRIRVKDNNRLDYSGDISETEPIVKAVLDIDPVLITKTITKGDRRIGYLLYDAFTQSTSEIIEAVKQLKSDNINELVLDLRLNGGGYINTLDTLASMLVPEGNDGKIFIVSTYNKALTEAYRRSEGKDFDKERFSAGLPNLGLSRLYVLTSASTASASEELISGLSPYMPVTIIGDQTYGKFTSNILLNDYDDRGNDDDGIPYSEWALYICVGSCQNSLGQMDFKDGFAPDFAVKDTYAHDLGEEDEPLLSKAIECITGSLSKKAGPDIEGLNGRIGSYGKPNILKGAAIKDKKFSEFLFGDTK